MSRSTSATMPARGTVGLWAKYPPDQAFFLGRIYQEQHRTPPGVTREQPRHF